MTREEEIRLNTSYLDKALAEVARLSDTEANSREAANDRFRAETAAIDKKESAKYFFSQTRSLALKSLVITLAVSFLIMVITWSIGNLINKYNGVDIALLIDKKNTLSELNKSLLNELKTKDNEKKNATESIDQLKNSLSAAKNSLSTYTNKNELLRNKLSELENINIKLKENLARAGQDKKQENSALSVPWQIKRNSQNENCASNESYLKSCQGSHQYSSGHKFTGTWRNGFPNGEGRMELANGSSVQAIWKDGVVQKFLNPESKIRAEAAQPIKSVTVFATADAIMIRARYFSVVSGHLFSDGASKKWINAYCYAQVTYKKNNVRIDLSKINGFKSNRAISEYKNHYRNFISKTDFNLLESNCPYQWTGF